MLVKKYTDLLREINKADPRDNKSIARLASIFNAYIDCDPLLANRLAPLFTENKIDDENLESGAVKTTNEVLTCDEMKEIVAGLIDDIEVKIFSLSKKGSEECVQAITLMLEGDDTEHKNVMVVAISELMEARAVSGDPWAIMYVGATHVAAIKKLCDCDFSNFIETNILKSGKELAVRKMPKKDKICKKRQVVKK